MSKPKKYFYRNGGHGGIIKEDAYCLSCKQNTLVIYKDNFMMCSDCGYEVNKYDY